MGWRDRLQQASFRGVAFHVENRALSGGRRVVEHVYPQRDGSETEDMGRQAHTLSVRGYLFGTNYDAARDALITALERGGKGTYSDPWGKHHTVVCRGWSVSESLNQGGMATFEMTFLEQTGEIGHRVETDTAHAATTSASKATLAAVTSFKRTYNVAGTNVFLADAVAVLNVLGSVVSNVAGITAAVTDRARALVAVAQNPALLADGLMALFSALGSAVIAAAQRWAVLLGLTRFAAEIPAARACGGVYGTTEAATPWVRAATNAQLSAAAQAATTGAPLSVADRLAVNRAALVAVVGDLALAHLVEVASTKTYDNADAALADRDTLAARIDERLESADDGVFRALLDMQSATVSDLTYRAAQLDQVVAYTPATATPALVLAHRLYGDASQAAAICERNNVRHPGMIPGGVPLSIKAKKGDE